MHRKGELREILLGLAKQCFFFLAVVLVVGAVWLVELRRPVRWQLSPALEAAGLVVLIFIIHWAGHRAGDKTNLAAMKNGPGTDPKSSDETASKTAQQRSTDELPRRVNEG